MTSPLDLKKRTFLPSASVLMPTRSKQKAGGQELEVSVSKVGVNEAIPPDIYNPPADVKALVDKSKGN